MRITQGLVEQHIHGAFGIDFMKCSEAELIEVALQLAQNGVCTFFPTIMTDNIDIIKERISIIKNTANKIPKNYAQIAGIHLEGPFINPDKAGIHEKKYIQPLDIEFFKQLDDSFIKIITIAPELDKDSNFIKYLQSRNIKISAGHCTAYDLSGMNQVTHLYNAMQSFTHRGNSTVVSALTNDNIYTEIIADSMHVSDEVLKITFRQKPLDKILLISDALPLAHSKIKEQTFAGQTIYNKDGKLINKEGVFAGSSMLLCDIIKNIVDKKIIKFEDAVKCASSNQIKYHNLTNNLTLYWNDNNVIEKVKPNN
ncbi:MAG: hypothetical protein LUG16_08705 [Candidatus Gastranaerophilales bacterium]|nr:hypothetical protein [Candidatus Gastranaerophilales bacterium]